MSIIILAFFILVYAAAFCLLIATGTYQNLSRLGVAAKSLTSLCFIGIALASSLIATTTALSAYETSPLSLVLFYRMLPALLLCFLGDVFLEINQRDEKKRFFIPGLIAFLLGHVGFVIAYDILSPFSFLELIIPALAVLLTFFLTRLKLMDTGKMRPYVLIYSFFVAWLLSKGLFVLIYQLQNTKLPIAMSIFIFIGSMLFFISDVIILFLMFYTKKYKYTRFFNLLTYYGAQLFLGLSLLFTV